MTRIATLITALVAAGAFASHAQAHQLNAFDRFDGPPFFRDRGEPHLNHCEARRRMEMEEQMLQQQRAEKFQQMRAARAAAAAAAERRARLAAILQQKAKAAAAADAAQKRNLEAAKTPASAGTDAAKKTDAGPISTASITPARDAAVASSEVCRRYSTAADAIVDVPCQ